jgi:flagellin
MTEISTINGNTEYNGLNVFSDAANVFTSDGNVSQTYASTALGSTSSDSLGLGTEVYVSGTVAAASTAQVGKTDSYGNTIAATDNVLAAADSNGKAVTVDLTAMGNSTTVAGALSTSNAVAISNGKAIAGSVQAAAATATAGTSTTAEIAASNTKDEYGVTIGTGDEVFTNIGVATSTTIDLGTTTAPTSTAFAGTSLDSTAQAEAALTAITSAISKVASNRGSEGAEVNTLTAVENVQTTQSTNTTSAENDVMATDYSSTTSNLSKFEILEQTGISALAQANSTEQLVTKLLQ